EIALVIASRDDCRGLEKAKENGIPTAVVARGEYPSVNDFSGAIFDRLRQSNADLVTLAGFLSLIEIPQDFHHRVMNIHPALIPSFCGRGFFGHKVHEAVLDRGAKITGCTVHFADNEYDHGPIILQSSVPVLDDDTPDKLAARVFAAECEAYPEAIRRFAAGRLEINGCRVRTRQSGC
ncbi:MAG: phosphoribosylglycinamide formyltransferase, partial [Planctomycetes bacterium]|nr:phosphoribosylglycinamide formyltransferase [Planctomycetota bacterium]